MNQQTETGYSHAEPVSVSVSTPLLDAMRAYNHLERLNFTVPGHNGKPLAEQVLGTIPGLSPENYRFDYTELEGMDVLSEPSECLADAQAEAAKAFGVSQSFFLVNGATVGMMAGMLSVLCPGDKVLLPRNVHRSVLSGLILTGAEPVWFLPECYPDWGLWGAVTVEALARRYASLSANEASQIKALILSSPTYEGIGSDIPALTEFCKARDIFLIVDEAHGSLWPFSPLLPNSAVCCKPSAQNNLDEKCNQRNEASCDLVIHSLHKTAGSLTQTAMAHLPQGSRIDSDRFQQALNMLQTTSPSYLLLASLDATRAFLQSDLAQENIAFMLEQVNWLRQQLEQLCNFQLFKTGNSFWDPSKIVIRHCHLPGAFWAPKIEADGVNGAGKIAYEQATPYGVLYIAGLGFEHQDYECFAETFAWYDRMLDPKIVSEHLALPSCPQHMPCLPEMAMLPREAYFSPGETIPSVGAIGRIARQTVVHCPPGIPVLMPGERISEAHLSYLPNRIQVVR